MKLAQLRKDAFTIFKEGVKAVNPVNAVKSYLSLQDSKLTVADRTYDLAGYDNIYLIGTGKASAAMAQPIEKILGDRLKTGIVNVKYGHTVPLETSTSMRQAILCRMKLD